MSRQLYESGRIKMLQVNAPYFSTECSFLTTVLFFCRCRLSAFLYLRSGLLCFANFNCHLDAVFNRNFFNNFNFSVKISTKNLYKKRQIESTTTLQKFNRRNTLAELLNDQWWHCSPSFHLLRVFMSALASLRFFSLHQSQHTVFISSHLAFRLPLFFFPLLKNEIVFAL